MKSTDEESMLRYRSKEERFDMAGIGQHSEYVDGCETAIGLV